MKNLLSLFLLACGGPSEPPPSQPLIEPPTPADPEPAPPVDVDWSQHDMIRLAAVNLYVAESVMPEKPFLVEDPWTKELVEVDLVVQRPPAYPVDATHAHWLMESKTPDERVAVVDFFIECDAKGVFRARRATLQSLDGVERYTFVREGDYYVQHAVTP